jgi:endoglucanase
MSLKTSANQHRKFRYFLYFTVALSLLLGLVWGLDGRKTKAAQTTNGGFLHTVGNQIVDQNGNPVQITGLNWFGFETETYCLHMLWARNMEAVLDQVKSLGYNTLRIPYSNQMFDPGSVPNSFALNLNPDLQGLTALQILDRVVDYSGQIGLRIILDRHRPDSRGQSCLWYTPQYSEQRMINDWVMLANRYKGNPTVIGAELHNEPCDPACWGDEDCGGDVTRDWRSAAERIGNAILAVNPDWLIIVQGIQTYKGMTTWFGGQLAGVRDAPVRLSIPNKLVYSPHDYATSVFRQPWFDDPNYPNNLEPNVWNKNWGFIHTENIGALIITEFGTTLAPNVVDKDLPWLTNLVSYIDRNKMSFTYWCLNYNSVDTGGILMDDSTTVDFRKQNILAPILAPLF